MKINVVTLCSGYDSQCMALDRIRNLHPDFDYELVAWSEIDKFAIASHDAIYPQWADRNLGDMTKVDWTKIKEPIDLLTYSTPCSDISKVGLLKGLGCGTNSGILFDTERAIETLRPKYLMQENVKALVGKRFLPDFQRWCGILEELGYTNFWKVMNAKDYGVPQNRERVFMISVLDCDFRYEFPEPSQLENSIESILEEYADESNYLDDGRVEGFMRKMKSVPGSGTANGIVV